MESTRALLYCRTATPDAEVLEDQEKNLLAYARAHGFIIAGIVSEYSNGLPCSRTGLREVLTAIEDGKADILLISNLCRLGRSIQKTDALLGWLKARNVKIVCTDGTEPQTTLEIFDRLRQDYHSAL